MDWYRDNKKEWKEIIETVAREIGRSEEIVEKDTIQSMFLHNLYNINKQIVFKGGTSLSKVYSIIDRFSEDIDLSSTEKLTEKDKKKLDDDIKNIASSIGLDLINDDDIKSRYNYNKYYFAYNSLFAANKLEILVETNFFLKVFPVEEREVGSLIGNFCKNKGVKLPIRFDEVMTKMKVQSIERTFIDKVFAVCDYKIQNMEERDSRHLYDISKIVNVIKLDEDLKSLIKQVRVERQKSKNNLSASFQYDINNLLLEIISTRFYENDFNKVTKKLLYESIDYDDVIKNGIMIVVDSGIFK